jgi:glyoxalase-like protein
VRIDHVIWGTQDLDAASARMAAQGLTVVPGGHHVGQGSGNRIVPLGNAYIELMTIDDPEEAAGSPIGRVLLEVIAGEGWIGWAVAVDDVEAVARRLGTPVLTIEREGLFGRLTGVEEALLAPTLPFFIQGTSRPGEGGTDGLDYVEVAGDRENLREWLGGAELPVRVVDGAPALRAVGIGGRELRP